MEIRKPEMFRLSEQHVKSSLIKQILMFIIVFFVASLVGSIPAMIVSVNEVMAGIQSGMPMEELDNLEEQLMNSRSYMYASLFGTILSGIVVILYCRFIQKRSLRTIGFEKKHVLRNYVIGMLIGFIMFSAVVGISAITGAIKIEGISSDFGLVTLGYILIFLLGYIFQGAEEEILTRGYLMVNVGAKHKTITAIIVSAVVFSLLHIANTGVTVLSLINIALIGAFFGLYIICFDNIWGACAIHSIWNFTQGHIYGIKVSGMSTFESIFNVTNIQGKELINGGAFGAEGGIATTIVIVLSIALLLIYMKKTGRICNNSKDNSVKTENVEEN